MFASIMLLFKNGLTPSCLIFIHPVGQRFQIDVINMRSSPTTKKVLWANGLLWLLLAMGSVVTRNNENFATIAFALYMVIHAFACLVLGLILAFTPYQNAGKAFLLSGMVATLLTFATCGGLMIFE